MATLRENILKNQKAKARIVAPSFLADTDTPDVEVRIMTVERRSAMLSGAMVDGKQDAAAYEAMVVIETCFVPGTDEKVFAPADRDILKAMPSNVLDELAEPALEINGLLLTSLAVAGKN